MKTCSRCRVARPLDEFYKNKRMKDGHAAYCIFCDKIAKAEYYQRNREVTMERVARWQSENSNAVRLYKKEWKRRNPHSNRKYKLTRKMLESVEHFTEAEWTELLEAHGGRCLACDATDNLTADHVIPLTLGGSNHITNIQPLCMVCNSKKGVKVIDYR